MLNLGLDDGLIPCPICSERMKEEAVFSHLDVHNRPETASRKYVETARLVNELYWSATVLINPSGPNSFNIASSARQPPKPVERLPQLNYSLLKENAFRKKMSELGIPNVGPRALLIRRHTEWVNLVNANCDSLRPRSKRELLHELDVWDKTQGRQIANGSSTGRSASVMNKDFDGAAWAADHDNDFQALIARARKKAKPRTEVGNSTDKANTPAPDPSNAGEATLPPRNLSEPAQASFVNLEAEG